MSGKTKGIALFAGLAVAWLAVWWIWDRGMIALWVLAEEAVK